MMSEAITLINRKPKTTTWKLQFKYLPAFAKYILENRLREFVIDMLNETFAVDFPALKYFDLNTFSDEQLIELSMVGNKELLTYMANNNLSEQIKESTKRWVQNQLQNISKDQIVIEDISLTGYTRRKIFSKYIFEYATDVNESIKLIEELEEFLLESESVSFNTFINIQQEKINNINQSLKQHEEQLLEAQELALLGSFDWDLTGNSKSEFTPQLYKIFEMTVTSNLSDFLEYVHPSDRHRVKMAIDKAIKGDGYYECEYRYQRNEKEKIIWSRGVVSFKDGQAINMKGTVMDVTDRHYMLQRLQRNEELYKQAQAQAHIGNWRFDLRTNEMHFSDEYYRICGLIPQSEEISHERFLSFIHPDDKEIVLQLLNESIKSLQPHSVYYKMLSEDGTIKYIHRNVEVLSDETGKAYKVIGTGQDVTREFLLQKELERSNKELTSFNYVASHDLKEPLRKIKTFANRIFESDFNSLSAKGKEYFEKINSATSRMQKLIDDLQSFSIAQIRDKKLEAVDLNKIIDELKILYKESIDETHLRLQTDSLPTISGYSFQIHQLFENIIGNSLKYKKQGVTPVVTIKSAIVNGSQLSFAGIDRKLNYYNISISDNGIGFEQKHADQIFEVFQRLHSKSDFPGSGIGLSICKKIIENHNGFISAEGEINKGATFNIYLPVI